MWFFHHWTYDHFSQFDRSGLEFVQRPQHVLINFQIKWVKTSVLTINKIVQGTVCLEGKSWAVDSTQAQFFCRLFVKLFTIIAYPEAEIESCTFGTLLWAWSEPGRHCVDNYFLFQFLLIILLTQNQVNAQKTFTRSLIMSTDIIITYHLTLQLGWLHLEM